MAARFIDLSGNWAERSINILSDRAVIPAEKDGKFKPGDPVTRAILASWLVKVLGFQNDPVPSRASFPDVKTTDWYFKPVEILTQKHYLAAYPDGFRPHKFLTKAELVLILSRALPGSPPDDTAIAQELSRFKDGNKVPDWARAAVAKAARANILVNHPADNVIDATAVATRADTAAMLYQLQEFFYKQDIAEKVSEAKEAQTASGASSGGAGWFSGGDQGPYQQGGGAQTDGPDQAFASSGSYGTQAGQPFPASPQPYAGTQPAYPPPPQPSYPSAQMAYSGQPPVYQGQVQKSGAPGSYLQGAVNVVEAGSHFRATLNNTLNSGYNRAGEEFTCTVSEALHSGGSEVIPVGSKLIGQITNVVSAKNFRFSSNGKIDVKFTGVELPDGRRVPLTASIDAKQLKEAAGVRGGPVGTTLKKTGKGAVSGAKWGGLAGGIYGAATRGSTSGMLRGAGTGAIVGSLVGAAGGLVGAGVQKGSEVNVPAGTSLPIQLDEALQIPGGSSPSQQLSGAPGGYGAAPPQYGGYPGAGAGAPPAYPAQPSVQPYGYPVPAQQY
jgi:type IV secretory pathway VirB10-like protein